jgi:L-threonylcarbamoyladenylate synthase
MIASTRFCVRRRREIRCLWRPIIRVLYWFCQIREYPNLVTEVLLGKVSPDTSQRVEKGITILRRGGLVAFPTDTVYGLGAGMTLPQAVARVYAVKARPPDMALPLLVASTAQISEVARRISPVAWRLIERFLPGALTVVRPRSEAGPPIVSGGGDTVAVRIPAHPIPIALIKGLGTPIIGTSANLSGHPSPLTAEEVYSQLGDKVDLIIDGGRCVGQESTIVDVTGETPIILRAGAIPREEIERVCGSITFRKGD